MIGREAAMSQSQHLVPSSRADIGFARVVELLAVATRYPVFRVRQI
jgi:hypothetical protein